MRYMLLIAEQEGIRDTWSEQERQAAMQRWLDCTNDLREAGAFVAGRGPRRRLYVARHPHLPHRTGQPPSPPPAVNVTVPSICGCTSQRK